MASEVYIKKIKSLIADDNLEQAIGYLNAFLANTPQLDEAILQSAQFSDIRRQIRLGLVNQSEASLTQNQIRADLLDLLRKIETMGEIPALREEMEFAITIINSKNIVFGSTISARGNVEVGDRTIQTESNTSRRLRLFLFVFVPMLAIGGSFFWVRYQQLQETLSLTVALDNRTPNPELPFEGGTVLLRYGDKSETMLIHRDQKEVNFRGIPANIRDRKIYLHFEAAGFEKIDTDFVLSEPQLTMPIRRDNSLAHIFGTVRDESGNPVAGAQIIVQNITVFSGLAGDFSITLPFEKQRKEQRIRAFKIGFGESNETQTIVPNEDNDIRLSKK